MLLALLALAFGYLLGSVPSGVIISRLGGVADPRNVGSGNIGATNVLRSGRKDLAALTLIADALKGAIAVLVAARFDTGALPVHLASAAACGAFLGHLFSLFLGFRGGKGVATFLGCLFGLAWPAGIGFVVVWLAVAVLTKYSSAGALAASAATPALLLVFKMPESALLFTGLAVLLWWKHAANISRLLAGTEHKIGQKSGAA